MQMVKRIVGGFFLMLTLLWLLAPKEEIYYLLEKSLKKSNIIISNEEIIDKWYGLKLLNADIYVEGVKLANASELNFDFFLVFNRLTIKEIKTDESLHAMAPKEINLLEAKYSLLNPVKIELTGQGSFGEMQGEVQLLDRKVEVLFPVEKDLKALKKFLKKDATKGWYYEKNY